MGLMRLVGDGRAARGRGEGEKVGPLRGCLCVGVVCACGMGEGEEVGSDFAARAELPAIGDGG